jgi:hypothetical protein
MFSQLVRPTINQPAQKPDSEEFQLSYDKSIRLYVRARAAGIPADPVNQFLFRDQNGLEKAMTLEVFFREIVPQDMPYYEFVHQVQDKRGPCHPADLEENVAFLHCRDLFGFSKVVCINSGVTNMECVRSLFITFQREPDSRYPEGVIMPSVSRPDAKFLHQHNVVIFKKG